MFIRRMELVNIGPHEHSEVVFDEGFNVIRGRNWHGKTWIIRALFLALFNTGPKYEDLRCNNNDEQQASILLELSDGRTIHRFLGKRSEYVLRSETGETSTVNPGRGINDVVSSFLGMGQIVLSNSISRILHIQGQHDSDFLIHESNSNIDQALGRMVGADIIERATADIASKRRSTKERRNKVADELQGVEGKLTAYANLDRVGLLLDEIDLLQSTINVRTERIGVVNEKVGKLKEAVSSSQPLNVDLPGLEHSIITLQTTERRIAVARNYCATLTTLRELQDTAQALRDVIAELEGLMERQSLLDKAVDYHTATQDVVRATSSISNREHELAALDENIRVELMRLGKCPTCGSLVNPVNPGDCCEDNPDN